MFLSVVFSNSTVSAVVIPNPSVFDTLFNLVSRCSLRNLVKLHVLSGLHDETSFSVAFHYLAT